MSGGMMMKVMHLNDQERRLSTKVHRLDDALANLRNNIRLGEELGASELEVLV
jgi:hypothetical protein